MPLIDKSFGVDTAVEEAQRSIRCAHAEAHSAVNGIGLVKLMGRHSGHIAIFASLASREVDCCLVPEVGFILDGPLGLLKYIQDKLNSKGHMVIVVAEGAAQKLLGKKSRNSNRDPSGNVKMPDVGLWLKTRIERHFNLLHQEINIRLLDPTCEIRSVPANASDNLLCGFLAQSAIHGAMHGYTGFSVGQINNNFVMIPMEEVCARSRTQIDAKSRTWHRVIACTQQPHLDGLIREASARVSTAPGSEREAKMAQKTSAETVGAPVRARKLVGCLPRYLSRNI